MSFGNSPERVRLFLYSPFLLGCTCAFSLIGQPVPRLQDEAPNVSAASKKSKQANAGNLFMSLFWFPKTGNKSNEFGFYRKYERQSPEIRIK